MNPKTPFSVDRYSDYPKIKRTSIPYESTTFLHLLLFIDMAANMAFLEIPFPVLYAEASDDPLPATEGDVVAALAVYGAKFQRGKAHKDKRADLLAGIRWLHASHDVIAAELLRASPEQQRCIALGLSIEDKFDEHGKLPAWPALVLWRLLAFAVPGGTPIKRSVPAEPPVEQIVKPGGPPELGDPETPKTM
jgi:hypothetical protein